MKQVGPREFIFIASGDNEIHTRNVASDISTSFAGNKEL